MTHIVQDPEIMGGEPVLRGTRIPPRTLLARIEGGESVEDILQDYPALSREAVEEALDFARREREGTDADVNENEGRR